MKKPTRKLALAGETIRQLRLDAKAAGGMRPPYTLRTCSWTECEPPTLYVGCML